MFENSGAEVRRKLELCSIFHYYKLVIYRLFR